MNFKNLEKHIGFKFSDQSLLQRAFVHRSYLNEVSQKGLRSNERLEFLGDAVLELVISEWLFELFPTKPEGVLTNLRSNIVRTTSLSKVAQDLSLGQYLLMSRGEKESGGFQNPSLLANTVEAVIGALYLDKGLFSTQQFIRRHFASHIESLSQKGECKDAKSLLQEKLQAKTKFAPTYRVLNEEGPDHDKKFTVGVYSQSRLLAKGSGKSLKTAEETAAKRALIKVG